MTYYLKFTSGSSQFLVDNFSNLISIFKFYLNFQAPLMTQPRPSPRQAGMNWI